MMSIVFLSQYKYFKFFIARVGRVGVAFSSLASGGVVGVTAKPAAIIKRERYVVRVTDRRNARRLYVEDVLGTVPLYVVTRGPGLAHSLTTAHYHGRYVVYRSQHHSVPWRYETALSSQLLYHEDGECTGPQYLVGILPAKTLPEEAADVATGQPVVLVLRVQSCFQPHHLTYIQIK